MTVADAGGFCECTECGVTCTGRFRGCAAILARPGHVPAVAPPWAVAGTGPPPSGAEESPEATPALTPARASELEPWAGAVASIREELAERDDELVRVLGRIVDACEDLAERFEADRRVWTALLDALRGAAADVSIVDADRPARRAPVSPVLGGSVWPSGPPTPGDAAIEPPETAPTASGDVLDLRQHSDVGAAANS